MGAARVWLHFGPSFSLPPPFSLPHPSPFSPLGEKGLEGRKRGRLTLENAGSGGTAVPLPPLTGHPLPQAGEGKVFSASGLCLASLSGKRGKARRQKPGVGACHPSPASWRGNGRRSPVSCCGRGNPGIVDWFPTGNAAILAACGLEARAPRKTFTLSGKRAVRFPLHPPPHAPARHCEGRSPVAIHSAFWRASSLRS